MATDDRFESAAQRMRENKALSLSNESKLQLYGYYKQATEGVCHTPKPGIFDFTGRAKWEAWNKLGDMAQDAAKASYMELVDRLDPGWDNNPINIDTKAVPDEDSSGQHGTGGPVVSRLLEKADTIPDSEKTLLDWCKEGNVERLQVCLEHGDSINTLCDQGMAPLHWGCDRGHLNVVTHLIAHGADVNIQDSEGQTPLHYASCGHEQVLKYLLTQNADTAIRDTEGGTAQDVCDPSVAHVFNL